MPNLMYTHPRQYGKDSRHCRVCKTTRGTKIAPQHSTTGLIRKYGLFMCRRCFRERAEQIGFVKVPPLEWEMRSRIVPITLFEIHLNEDIHRARFVTRVGKRIIPQSFLIVALDRSRCHTPMDRHVGIFICWLDKDAP